MNKSVFYTIIGTVALGLTKIKSGNLNEYRSEWGVFPNDLFNLSKKERSNITTLVLEDLQIEEIPNGFFEGFDNLEALILDNNNLTEIPETITNIRTLKKLYLFGNEIKSIPHHIKNLENLEFLGATGNAIQYISPEIGSLIKLEQLYLSENHIKSLPREIGNLINLRYIHLVENEDLSYPDPLTAVFWAKNLSESVMNHIALTMKKTHSSSQLRKF